MGMSTEYVFKEALQLPESERARLVAELLATLKPKVPASGRSEREWIAEVERRARAALEGAPGLPWVEARDRAQDRLAGK